MPIGDLARRAVPTAMLERELEGLALRLEDTRGISITTLAEIHGRIAAVKAIIMQREGSVFVEGVSEHD